MPPCAQFLDTVAEQRLRMLTPASASAVLGINGPGEGVAVYQSAATHYAVRLRLCSRGDAEHVNMDKLCLSALTSRRRPFKLDSDHRRDEAHSAACMSAAVQLFRQPGEMALSQARAVCQWIRVT